MVMLPKHLNVKVIVLTMGCSGRRTVPKGRYCDVTMIRPLLFHGIHADMSGSPGAAIVHRQSIVGFQSDLLHISVK